MSKPSQRPQSLQVSDFKCYLNIPPFLLCYKKINRAGSLESDVDNFYCNFLKEVFTSRDNFGLEQKSRAASEPELLRRTDLTIRYVTNDGFKQVVLCQNKRRDKESQTSVWTDALQQAVEYATLIRTEREQDKGETLYITVNVGTYLRFYELPGFSTEARDWAPAEGQVFELANDEERVWELWHKIRDLIISH